MKQFNFNPSSYETLADDIILSLGMVSHRTRDTLITYLRKNVPEFNYLSIQDCNNARKGVFREYFFKGDAESFVMRTGSPRVSNKIKFALKDTIGVLEALDDNPEMVMFYHDMGSAKELLDRRNFKKQLITKDNAFCEIFYPTLNAAGKRVITKIYDRNEILAGISILQDEIPGLVVLSNASFVSGVAEKVNLKPKYTVEASYNDDVYTVVLYDHEGKEIETKIIYGKNMYDAYYSYMVEKGYFTDNNEKDKPHII